VSLSPPLSTPIDLGFVKTLTGLLRIDFSSVVPDGSSCIPLSNILSRETSLCRRELEQPAYNVNEVEYGHKFKNRLQLEITIGISRIHVGIRITSGLFARKIDMKMVSLENSSIRRSIKPLNFNRTTDSVLSDGLNACRTYGRQKTAKDLRWIMQSSRKVMGHFSDHTVEYAITWCIYRLEIGKKVLPQNVV
jgi:hypothetical protein